MGSRRSGRMREVSAAEIFKAESDKLRAANAELVEALKGIELEIAHDHVDGSIQIIIEALAKHGCSMVGASPIATGDTLD